MSGGTSQKAKRYTTIAHSAATPNAAKTCRATEEKSSSLVEVKNTLRTHNA